jgi:tetratricopeptide (TPR) repeat protein
MREILRETEPRTPSIRVSRLGTDKSTTLTYCFRCDADTLQRRLRGDLDWITLKAMEKDPERRYVSAHAFAEDIRCYLNHQPVSARSPTIAYRVQKFIRRNRIQVIAAVVAIVLFSCIVTLAVMYTRSSQQARTVTSLRDRNALQKAQEAFSEQRFVEALELLNPIVGSEDVGSQARLLQANILLEGGHLPEAETILSSLLHNKPEIAGTAHALLARIYWENSDSQTNSIKQAVYHRNEAERLLPETANAFYLGALTSLTVKETMEMLEKALILDPRHYPSRRLHACTLWASQRYLEMETDALALIVSRPKDSFGYFLSAIARFELKKYEHALQDIERALQLTLEDTTRRSELLELRCRTHLVLGQYQRVVFEAENCIKQFPDKTIFSFHKFCAYLGLGQYDQACTTFYQVAESSDQAKQELINWSMKYVFDSLAAGRNWHSPGKRPEGAPFVHMQEAEYNYKEFASKGRRLINKGFAADFSPDGTKLAYSSGAVGSSGIALYDFNTEQNELLIVPGNDPRWSPDGQYIAFVRDRQILDMAVLASVGYLRLGQREMEQEVWIMRSDGAEARRLALGAWPSWSSDNRYVFYHSRKQNALCKIEAHDLTASPERLLETERLWPSVSPDGRHVAWIYSDNRLCITNLEGSAFKPIHTFDFPDLRFYGGKWAPSGRWFSLGGYNPTVQAGLWIYDMDLGLAKKVLSGLAGTARWSADEKSLVYLVEAPILELWMADIDSIGPGKTFAEHDREMVTYYTRMIQAYPEKAQYYLSRASNYSRLNELEKAIADIERADAITGRTENTARWLARLKAACKAGDAILDVPLAGSMSYDSTTGIYTLVGAGLDIWHLFDEFHFAYMQLRGNGSIAARIDKIEHVHNWTKAGLMIRNTLDPASENGTALITPAGRVVFQWRDREMGITRGTITDRNSITLPYWRRLTRKGNQFTAHHSSDGVQWDAVVDPQNPNKPGLIEIQMNETVHIGLAVSSHNTTRTVEAWISNVTITGSVTPSGPLTFSQEISFK